MVELTCIASHFQAARFLAVPEPGREAVTISDALLRAIDCLRSKLDDYALHGVADGGFKFTEFIVRAVGAEHAAHWAAAAAGSVAAEACETSTSAAFRWHGQRVVSVHYISTRSSQGQ